MTLKSIAAVAASSLFFVASAAAETVTLTLSSSYPSGYTSYNYTATDGSSQSQVVGPYPVTLSDTNGLYHNTSAYAFCFDINNPSNVGTGYTGHFAYNTDTATMEATYLINELNASGLYSASTSLKGAISMAIWALMFPSSTKTDGTTFKADPAATAYETQAAQAVASGQWTVADSNLYPAFIPDNTASQRFGVVLPGTNAVNMSSQTATPEPGSLGLFLLGAALLAAGRLRRRAARS